MFDDPADNREVPQKLEKGTAEHDPGRMPFAAQFIHEENFGDPGISVTAVFKKETPFTDDQDIAYKNLIQKSKKTLIG